MNILEIKPYFKDKNAIATSCSNEHVPYLSVYLTSIKEKSKPQKFYDIIIFENSITDRHKKQLIDIFNTSNFIIRFCNPASLLENVTPYISHSYFKTESYHRIIAPVILKKYQKLIFTDIDLIIQEDISQLFNIPLQENVLAATTEKMWQELYEDNHIIAEQNIRYYTDIILEMEKPYNYFNTGVCIIDIQKYNQLNAFENILKLIEKNKFIYQEQCALNFFFKGNIYKLPEEWNFELADSITKSKKIYYENYLKKLPQAKILHFLDEKKPWFYTNIEYSELWWQYARQTPFYEEILQRLIDFRISQIKPQANTPEIQQLRKEFVQVHFL